MSGVRSQVLKSDGELSVPGRLGSSHSLGNSHISVSVGVFSWSCEFPSRRIFQTPGWGMKLAASFVKH